MSVYNLVNIRGAVTEDVMIRLFANSAMVLLFVLSTSQAFAETDENLGEMNDAAWAIMRRDDASPQEWEKAEALMIRIAERWAFAHADLGLIVLHRRNDVAAAARHFEIAGNAGTGLADRYLAQLKLAGRVTSADPLAEAAFLLERGSRDPSCWDCLYRAGDVAARRGDFRKAADFWLASAAKGDPLAADALAAAITAGQIASNDPKVEAAGWRILGSMRYGKAEQAQAQLRQEGVFDDIIVRAHAWAADRLKEFQERSP